VSCESVKHASRIAMHLTAHPATSTSGENQMSGWQTFLLGAAGAVMLLQIYRVAEEMRAANAKLQRIIELLVDNGFTLK
jgi:poly-D-alanine transfer protein DltD